MMDIFDLKNQSDLPDDLKRQLSANRFDEFSERIISLLETKSPLSLDEMCVGYYRKFGSYKLRKDIMTKVYNMSRSQKFPVQRLEGKKATYALTNKKGQKHEQR